MSARTLRTLPGLLALGTLAACASLSASRPLWIDEQPEDFPNDRFVIGRGQGGNSEDAQDRARADLAKTFEVQVQAESTDLQSFRRVDNKEEIEQNSSRRVQTFAKKVLEGVEIARLWRDEQGGETHALAVLERRRAQTVLRSSIAQLDDAMQAQLLHARDKAEDPLKRAAAAARALTLQAEREAMQKSLRVLDRSGQGIAAPINPEDLRLEFEALLANIKISPRLQPSKASGAPELGEILKGTLAQAGFLAESSAPYILSADLSLEDLGQREGWFWQRGTLRIQLSETATARARGTQSWSFKAAQSTKEAARREVLRQAEAALKKELRGAIIGFAAQQ